MNFTSNGRSELEHMEGYNVESMAIYRKLQSKVEALNIMKKELEKYRTERDQFKLMAETLQMRYSAMKNSISQEVNGVDYSHNGSSVRALLTESRQKNITLQAEVDTLQQRLAELEGDIRVLRKNYHDKKVAAQMTPKVDSVENAEKCESWNEEKSSFIAQLEQLKKQNAQLKYDFKSILDEKEELVTERDAYKCKAHRLNYELNVAMKNDGPESKLLDLDSLVLENKLLQEKVDTFEEEVRTLKESEKELKLKLEKNRKKGIMKSNKTDNANPSDPVRNLLEQFSGHSMKPELVEQLKNAFTNLLDTLNDKDIALVHQRKANKLLATKIANYELRFIGEAGQESNTKSLSPSAILLRGYAASKVDNDSSQSFRRYDDDPITLSPAASSSSMLRSRGISSESFKSENSSDYEPEKIQESTIRSEFRDLPADLAEMVLKSLQN